MEADVANELAQLKREIQELRAIVLPDAKRPDQAQTASSNEDQTATDPSSLLQALVQRAKDEGHPGLIAHYGCYNNAAGQWMRWESKGTAVSKVFSMDDGNVADVLSALASKPRIAILKAVIQEPRTASELVEHLGLGTTGQVYHHINVLQAANLIEQGDERGVYRYVGRRMTGFLLLLEAVWILLRGEAVWSGTARASR